MNYLEILGTIVGLVYLWLEYKASIWLWITGVIMPAIYIFIYYDAGLYADMGINVYYLGAAIYGLAVWAAGSKKNKGELPITHTPVNTILPMMVICIVSFLGIAWLLINYTNSDVPWIDSFTTALSIIGMWMLARKYLEQWLVWLVVDVVSAGLYIYKELYFTSGLYAVYAVIAIFGYCKWKKMMINNRFNITI
ncbi:nicotinamide riboside transporter PnuC [Bacteroides sp. 519]|uniref:nicotinamide riboside transporter PnuC n=1 Tax=Bacteroides sp. 519 TaxID=2302937 RepID=UPI0013D3D2EC|nr:nicotinamide riboside transporter PnuC [Bacteroides sp. 519]NDV58877.1 nicotinamide riboside transporter PnuC [Bacteroides sp. 519]